MKRLVGSVALVILIGIVVSSCGASRPSVEEWETTWGQIVSIVPDQNSITDDQSEKCGRALASLRANKDQLFPTPDPVIDETVNLWIETAESTFFDCPMGTRLQNAYDELFRLQKEIETVLAIDGG